LPGGGWTDFSIKKDIFFLEANFFFLSINQNLVAEKIICQNRAKGKNLFWLSKTFIFVTFRMRNLKIKIYQQLGS